MYPPPGYQGYPPPQPPPRRAGGNKVLWIVLGSVGGALLLGGLCCGGIIFAGIGMVENDVAAGLRDNPTLVERIGTLDSLDVNWTLSADYEDPDTMVYDVRGSKGSGVVIVNSLSTDDGEEIRWATLRLSDGTEFELVAQGP